MLVIIGLIVGGVLVGQSLISAAEVRAQITQIEKYNSAVNTFRGKFNYLPGDMDVTTAQQNGFTIGTSCTGQHGGRDGNGLLDGYGILPYQGGGETALFWSDLTSNAANNLIEGQFPNSGGQAITCQGANYDNATGTRITSYLPQARIGHGNYIYVYELSGINWYVVSAVTQMSNSGGLTTAATIPVIQAYNIDKKIDDGIPDSGNVVAKYMSAYTGGVAAPSNATSGGDATTCYDTTTGNYSITVNNGNGGNCALSFRFQ